MRYVVLTILFLLAQAFFSGIEVGLLSLRKTRVRHAVRQGQRRAAILDFFITHPQAMLPTTLIGTNICIVCSANSAKMAFLSLGYSGPLAMLMLACIMTLLFIYADVIPKDWFRQDPFHRCMFFAYPLQAAYFLLFIPMKALSAVNSAAVRLFAGKPKDWDSAKGLVREDFRTLLRESESGGVIDSEAAVILDRALGFHSMEAGDICCRADDVVTVPNVFSISQGVELCRAKGKSRMPVRDVSGNWIGLFSIYEAIFEIPGKEWDMRPVQECMRPLETVGENAGMDTILTKAITSGTCLLAVSDPLSPGKFIGIVTVSDVNRILFGKDY